MTKLHEAADAAAKAAQAARSKRYHIGIKDGGSVTKPGEWKDVPDSEWGDPVNYSYPMADKSHADNAASRWGDAANRAQYSDAEQTIIGDRIAARQAHFGEKKEASESAAITAGLRPKDKIATIRVCFLEYNARSLNGRIYPKSTCDAIFASMMRKLADPNALPMTCFVSHEAANGNVNTQLVGAIRGGAQEGSKFYADIDIADTSVARDQLALIAGRYMQSESLRVYGVDTHHDSRYDLPLVVPAEGAEQVEMMGIDLTTRPGLIDTARIKQVLYETEQRDPYSDAFVVGAVAVEEEPMTTPLYVQIAAQALTISEALRMTPSRQAHKNIHDHLAGVLDATVKAAHGAESARLMAAVESQIDEAGRAIAQKHAVHLAAAHDEAAKQLGMDCEGAYNDALGVNPDDDMDGDGIPDDLDPQDDGEEQARQKGRKPLTEEQKTIAALKARGYNIEAPKSADEKVAALEARLEEQAKQFEAKLAALSESRAPEPQRKTAALSQMNAQQNGKLTPETLYESGDYLKGTLTPANWKALADPRVPWPEDLDPDTAIFELAPFLNYRLLAMQEAAQGHDLRGEVLAGVYD